MLRSVEGNPGKYTHFPDATSLEEKQRPARDLAPDLPRTMLWGRTPGLPSSGRFRLSFGARLGARRAVLNLSFISQTRGTR